MELRCPFCDSPLPANLPTRGSAECPFCRAKVDLAAAWALQQGGADVGAGSKGLELDLSGVTDEPGSGKATEAYIRPEALATTAYTREVVPPDLKVERVGSYSLRGTDNPNARESVFPGGAGRPAAQKPAAAQQPAPGAKNASSQKVPRPPGTARMKSEFAQPPPRQEPGRPAAGGGGGRPPGSSVKPPAAPVPPVAPPSARAAAAQQPPPKVAPAQPARGHAAAAADDPFASLFTSPVSPVTGFTGVQTADEASAQRAAPAADPLAAWGESPAFGGTSENAFGGGAGRGDASSRASGGPSAVSVPAGGFGDFDLPSEFDLGSAPVASATPSAMEPLGQPAAGAPPGQPVTPDVGSPFDNLSGAVPSAAAPAPGGPGKAAQAPSADGDPFGALDFSFDDLAPGTLPGADGATNPGVTGRVQGRPPGSGLGAIDLDDVLSEDAGTDVVMPWTSARPKQTVQIGAAPEIPEPGHSLASGFAPGPGYGPGAGYGSRQPGAAPGGGADPTADLDLDGLGLPDSWAGQGGQAAAGGGEDLAGLTLDYGVTEQGGLALDLGGGQGGSASLGVEGPAAAPPPVAIKTKTPRARGLGLTGAPKVALLAVLLLGLVGVILGQTDYGYFGVNLLSGGAERPTARKALPPPGATSGIARDTNESFLEEVERLERLVKGEEKNAQHRADLLEVLLRFRERYPALFSVGSKLDMRLKELQRGTQMSGQKADMVRVMDLVTSGKYDEARVLLDGMVALSAQDADVLYFYGKVALGQNKADEALRYFELALLKNPGSITAKYFLAMTHVARKDVARAKATLEEILSREANHLPSKLAMAELAFDGKDYEAAARLAGEIVAKARSGSDSHELFGAHLVVAKVADARGSADERLQALRAALAIQPDHEVTAVAAARILSGMAKKEDALAVLEPCRQKGCSGEPFLIAYAETANAAGKEDLADAAVKEGIEKYPAAAAFPLIKGRHLLATSRVKAAIAAFEDALKASPESEDAWVLLATGLGREGKLSDAASTLQDGLGKVKSPLALWVALAGVQRELRDHGAAEESLRKATALDPANHRAQQDLGLVVAAQGRAEEAARILAALDSKQALDRIGIMGLADAWLTLREPGKARDLLAKQYARIGDSKGGGADDADLAAEYGRALMESGALQRSEEVLRKLATEHPSHARAHYYLGLLATKQGDKAKAAEALLRAVQLDATNHHFRLELARSLLAIGTVDAARDARIHLDTIVTAYGRGDERAEDREADAYVLRGRMLFTEQKYGLAMKDFEAALGLAPTRLDIMVGFGRTLYEMARYGDAAPYFRQVITRDSAHADANYFLGRILLHERKIDEAKVHLQRAVQRDPKLYPEAHRQLGLIYKDQGLTPLARKSFETYLATAPKGTAEAEEVKRMLDRMQR